MRHLALPALLVSFLAACSVYGGYEIEGSGIAAEEQRDVRAFRSVALRAPADVTVEVGPEPSLSITADDNLLPILETFVDDGRLVIRSEPSYHSKIGVQIRLTTPTLRAFSLEGSGDVVIRGVDAVDFRVTIAGSGDVEVHGRADALDASIAGSGEMRLTNLKAREASLEITGSGDMAVDVAESLAYRIVGSGDIVHTGGATTKGKVVGSGSVRQAGR